MFERVSDVDAQAYAIAFEIRLPTTWNGRFFYQANGGLDGIIVPALGAVSGGGPLAPALAQGFAAGGVVTISGKMDLFWALCRGGVEIGWTDRC